MSDTFQPEPDPTLPPELRSLMTLVRAAAVSVSFHFSDGDGSWYFTINSTAPSECWSGKSRGSFGSALEDAMEAVARIKPGQ